jgi:glycosyltransferase involved in cell wall biosynthesis
MTRGRAIVVTGRMPWPLDDGGRVDLWQSVKACSRRWDLTLLTLVDPGAETAPLPDALAGFEVVRISHRRPSAPLSGLRSLFGPWPYPVVRARSRALERRLAELVTSRRPDVVWLNQIHTATSLESLGKVPVVLRQQNLEHRFLERYAASLRSPLARAYATQQARRMRDVEARVCSRCDLVLAVHDLERDALRQLAPGARVETLPIGVDVARFLPRAPESPPVVLLAGSFGWPPNAEGAARFLAEGWPRLRERVAGVRLRLAGKGISADLAEQARAAGADPVGYVDDMAVEFARAAALVVPLWVGAGARVKIIEALTAGLPVVSTAIGVEGLGLIPGTHHLEAETPQQLGVSLANLLLDASRARTMADAGQAFAASRFSLDAVSGQAAELVAETIARVSGARR